MSSETQILIDKIGLLLPMFHSFFVCVCACTCTVLPVFQVLPELLRAPARFQLQDVLAGHQDRARGSPRQPPLPPLGPDPLHRSAQLPLLRGSRLQAGVRRRVPRLRPWDSCEAQSDPGGLLQGIEGAGDDKTEEGFIFGCGGEPACTWDQSSD